MRVKTGICAIIGLAVMALAAGCVPQDRYDQVVMANRSLKEQLVSVEEERNAARNNLETVRQQLSRAIEERNRLETERNQLDRELERLAGDYESLTGRLDDLEIGPLPEDIEFALDELAQQYPDLITFDAERGMLRFASDFTFGLGSVELTSDARQSLQRLADVLRGGSADGLEVHVIGHTDNVPVSRPATRERHPNNVYLSAHRAISVRDVLTSEGVNPNRVMVAGFGEHRPVVPNQPGGTEQNRRVEIFLVPMTEQPAPVESAPASDRDRESAPSPSRTQRDPDIPQK